MQHSQCGTRTAAYFCTTVLESSTGMISNIKYLIKNQITSYRIIKGSLALHLPCLWTLNVAFTSLGINLHLISPGSRESAVQFKKIRFGIKVCLRSSGRFVLRQHLVSVSHVHTSSSASPGQRSLILIIVTHAHAWCFRTAGGNPMKRADGEHAKCNKISHWWQTYMCGPLPGLEGGGCVVFGWLRVSILNCRWTLSSWVGRSHLLASWISRPHYQSPLPVLHLRLQSQRSVFWIEDDQ